MLNSRSTRSRDNAKAILQPSISEPPVVGCEPPRAAATAGLSHKPRPAVFQRNIMIENERPSTGRKRKAVCSEDGGIPSSLREASVPRSPERIAKHRKRDVTRQLAPLFPKDRDIAQEQRRSQSHNAIRQSYSPSTTLAPSISSKNPSRRTRPLLKYEGNRGEEMSAEVEQLKQELLKLKEQKEAFRQDAEKRAEALAIVRKDVTELKKTARKQATQVEKLKDANKKLKDSLVSIEVHLQCQICLELLNRPFALSPCGHILCQTCLQQWFRSAPQARDEDDVDNIPLTSRPKSCPCCRTRVRTRPIPLFVLKGVLENFSAQAEDALADIDPWHGIFPDSTGRFEYNDEDGERDFSSDSGLSSFDARYLSFGFSSDEEDDESISTGSASSDDSITNMVEPAWAPAINRATQPRRPTVSREHHKLLQRGATTQMIERYRMRFDRDHGLVAFTEEGTEIYLGWNIALPENDDGDGRIFMRWLHRDITIQPGSWLREEGEGHVILRRRIPDFEEVEVLGLDGDMT